MYRLQQFFKYIFVAIVFVIVGWNKEARTYSMSINQLGFTMNETLTDEAIQVLANKSAEAITPAVYSTIKDAFASFAPDTWVSALNKNGTDSALANSTNDQVKAILSSMNYTQDQVLSLLASTCSDGWDEILNLCHAVNATMSQLPPHIIQIFSKYNDSSMAPEDSEVGLIQDFKTITPDELVQMGDLFPKLKWLFSLNFYKLMDLLAQTVQGNDIAKMKFEQLGVSFYTQMLKKAHRYSLLIDAYVSTDRHWQFCNSMFADACNKMKIYEASGKHAF
uniref:Uncharacterized protein n=1 Tax=Meloidogyne floridensis TaxID=298350 RepID=A0A915P0D2_9BILA